MADNSIRQISGTSPRLGIGETSINPLSTSGAQGFHAAGDNGSYYTFRSSDQTQYQVPVGKKLIVTGGWFYANTTSMNFTIGYADTATNNGVPTNIVGITPGSSGSFSDQVITNSSTGPNTAPMYFEVPAGKYPFVEANGGQWRAVISAFEVDV